MQGLEGYGRFWMILANNWRDKLVGVLAGEPSLTAKRLADSATVTRGAYKGKCRAPEGGMDMGR